MIYKIDRDIALLNIDLTEYAILVLCHELGHKFDPDVVESMNQ